MHEFGHESKVSYMEKAHCLKNKHIGTFGGIALNLWGLDFL